MSSVFADTLFFLALLNREDPGHARATQLSRDDHRRRVTTDWVLVEVGDALARTGNRDVFAGFYDWIRNHSGTTIVPATRSLLENGVLFYRYRRDKDWPLTDCISFVVLEDEEIREALTGDKHFEQPGFAALLK